MLFLINPLFLISFCCQKPVEWQAAPRTEVIGWDRLEMPSVNILLTTKLLSLDPLSWDMDCLLTLWPLLIPCSLGNVPGASVRNSAHGKGHEEGGLAYAKAWSSLMKHPVPEHLSQNQSLSTLLFHALTYTSDFTGGSPPSPFLSEKELTCSSKSIKIPGRDKSVSA